MILVTPSQMEAIDEQTILSHGLSSLVLMENAARSVLPHLPDGPVRVLVGPGNNGGDGLVLARALHEEGREVIAYLFSRELSADAAVQQRLAESWGVPLVTHHDDESEPPSFSSGQVVVDALFGTGLSREPGRRYAQAIEAANRAAVHRVAIDIPSGVDGGTGQILGCAFSAHTTVTFGLAKWGHVVYPGKERCGRLIVTQPGFHPQSLAEHGRRVRYLTPELAATLLPRGWATMHKGDNGRLLLVTGSQAFPGAGLLSTLGALRGGAGLVSHAAIGELRAALTTRVPEALLVERDELQLDGFNAVVLGSGLGPDAARLGTDLLTRFPGPVVIDADALPLIGRFTPERRRQWVLTPHPGELARLLERPVTELEKNRIQTALDAARDLGAVVCFKGSPTVCACPGGRAFVNSSGNPLLAQGGSGDVLAGLIGAYISYGLPLLDAAAAAVYVHGVAADLLASDGCPRGAGAAAVAELLPRAFGQAIGKSSPVGVI